MQIVPEVWELNLIRAFDNAAMEQFSKDAKARAKQAGNN